MTRTDDETKAIIALLGGPKVFSKKIRDRSSLQKALRQGFPYAAFDSCLAAIDLTSRDLAALLGVAARTLARRKKSKQLSPTESDRLYRVARTAILATLVLGSLENARAWLHQENQALGGDSPVSQLDTEIGERQVEELLTRINYGVFS